MNSCTSCRQRKRKCDRGRPICSSCVRYVLSCPALNHLIPSSRSARVCTYDEDTSRQHLVHGPSSSNITILPESLGPVFASPSSGIDPFRYESLRIPTIEIIVYGELLKTLGDFDAVQEMATRYFDSINHRITILSKKRFFDRLPSLLTRRNAEDMALCLCMRLLQEIPTSGVESMQSSLYINVKSIMSLLTSTGFHSLVVIQSLVLMTFYEIGHAIYPSCSLSIAMCAKLARRVGLHKKSGGPPNGEDERIEHEEMKRVWWSILGLER
jgi:hypothetical protein